LRLLRSLPGPQNDAAIVRDFCAREDGFITALDSRHLAALKHSLPYESEVELLEFGRLAARFARLAGDDPKPLAGSAHFIGAIAEACESLEAESPFYGSRKYHGLHHRLAETIGNLAAWGFGSDTLGEVARECSDDLRPKLRSLSELWFAAEKRLADFGTELSYQHIARCLSSEPDKDVAFPRCLVFLDGQLTPKHVAWLKWATAVGAEVTVILESIPTASDLFDLEQTAQRELGIGGDIVGTCPAFVWSLFAGTVAESPGLEIEKFVASDPLSEVEWTLRRCLDSVASGEFHRMGLFVRNLEDYGPLIEATAERLGVPIRISRRAKLLSNGFLRSLLALLDALASSDPRRLQVMVKSSYFLFPMGLRKEFVDELSTAYSERVSAASKVETWASANRETVPWLSEVLEWRKAAVGNATTFTSWRERVVALGKLFPAISLGQISERDLRAKNSFERAIGVRASFLEEKELSFEDAIAEFRYLLDQGEYTPPSAAYGVQVSNSPYGFAEVDRLYVLGMLEGVFPRRRSESPILTDADIQELSERRNLGFPMEDSFTKAKKERDAFAAICAVPGQSLTFSYPGTTEERDNIPAFYLEEVFRASGGGVREQSYPRSLIVPEMEDCRSESDLALRRSLLQPRLRVQSGEDISLSIRERIRAEQRDALNPRDLRTAWECPFRHFSQNALGLYPDRDRRRWYQLRNLPQRAQLIKQPDPDSAGAALKNLMLEELEQVRPRVSDSEWNLMRQGGERLIEDWVAREFRSREVWPKDVGTERASTTFGEGGLRSALPRVGNISGAVAGMSRMGPYKVVHLVESNTPIRERTSMLGLRDRDALYYGAHLMAAFEKGTALALEIETMSDGRMLMLLPRQDEPVLSRDVAAGLDVVDLAGESEAAVATEVFFEHVKNLLEQASNSIREVNVQAKPGDYCTVCDHGELCRQSSEFGEVETAFGSGYA